jgi:hypothetical protein
MPQKSTASMALSALFIASPDYSGKNGDST